MKTRRKIERQTCSETSESETDREYPRKSKNPNMGNNKNTRQREKTTKQREERRRKAKEKREQK